MPEKIYCPVLNKKIPKNPDCWDPELGQMCPVCRLYQRTWGLYSPLYNSLTEKETATWEDFEKLWDEAAKKAVKQLDP